MCSNVFKHVQTCSKLVQMSSNVFKWVQNLFECVKCVPACPKLVQMCSNVFKIVQKLSGFPVQGVRHDKQCLIQFILALHDLSKTPSSCFSSNLFLLLLVLLITNFFFLVNFLIYFYMNGVPVILSFRARNKNCVERLKTFHPDNFSSFRILSSQRILSGHLILIPSALRNYSIMGHYSPGTISFLQILRQDCPTIGKSKSVFKYCLETFKDNSANCWYFVAQGDLRRFYQVLLH